MEDPEFRKSTLLKLTGPKPKEIEVETFRINYLVRSPKVEKLGFEAVRKSALTKALAAAQKARRACLRQRVEVYVLRVLGPKGFWFSGYTLNSNP